jgi:hypothetical protein
MGPGALEVADIFCAHGQAFRAARRSYLGQHKVMSVIEQCRTAALRGPVLRCPDCQHDQAPVTLNFDAIRRDHEIKGKPQVAIVD